MSIMKMGSFGVKSKLGEENVGATSAAKASRKL